MGAQEDNILLVREQTTTVEVQAYDNKMHLKWEKELDFDKGRPAMVSLVENNGLFEVLYRHRRKGKYYLKMHRYNSSANLIDSTTIKKLGPAFFTPKYETILSEDERKLMLVDFDRISKFNVLMIDLDSMKVMWEHDFVSKEFFPLRELKEMKVDNRGNAYVTFDKDNRKSSRGSHRLEVFANGPDFAEETQIIIPLENFLTYDANFVIDNLNKKFVFAGLYSEKSIGRAIGYFFISVDLPNAGIITKAYHPFSSETISIFTDKKVNENRGITQVKMQEIVLRRDGGVLLFMERVKLDERAPVGLSDRYLGFMVDYYYNNVFVAALHPDGSNHWQEVLHKKQFSQDDGASYSSYFLLKTPRNIRVIFNDEIRNENMVSEYVLSPGGVADRNSVFNTENQNLRLRFKDAVQVASNEIIVASERKNRIKLVRVTY